jgi:hypothetical protein
MICSHKPIPLTIRIPCEYQLGFGAPIEHTACYSEQHYPQGVSVMRQALGLRTPVSQMHCVEFVVLGIPVVVTIPACLMSSRVDGGYHGMARSAINRLLKTEFVTDDFFWSCLEDRYCEQQITYINEEIRFARQAIQQRFGAHNLRWMVNLKELPLPTPWKCHRCRHVFSGKERALPGWKFEIVGSERLRASRVFDMDRLFCDGCATKRRETKWEPSLRTQKAIEQHNKNRALLKEVRRLARNQSR